MQTSSKSHTAIMNRNLQYLLISLTLLIACTSGDVAAQVSRVSTANPMTGKPYEKVYDYDFVDEKPQFPGGNCELFNFINETREYPYEAYKNKIEGRVLCTFIVNPDGSISNISVLRSAGNERLDREAMRVISMMPKWECGKMSHKPVAVRCYLPIAFFL